MTKFAQLILLLFVFRVPSTKYAVSENLTQLDAPAKDFQKGLTELKDTMATLNSLADIQKQLQELQRVSEGRMRAQHKEEELRETSRSVTLATDKKLLEDLQGFVHRKIKYYTQDTTQGEGKPLKRPKDCSDLYLEGHETSDVYEVWPLWSKDRKSFPVYCDMNTDGGGWTVIHRWKNPEVPKRFFHRYWKDYKNGFGDLKSAFWIGNELIYEMSRQGAYQLRFDFENESVKKHSTYDNFFIAGEDNNYKLHLGNYLPSGTAGDILSASDSQSFTALDRDNIPLIANRDSYTFRDLERIRARCEDNKVGWWYSSSCEIDSQIHALPSSPQTMVKTEMKIRKKSFLRKKESPL